MSQTLALWKTPLDLLRGASGEEKELKNAKDACATEALEIATYTALEYPRPGGRRRRDGQARGLDPRRRGADARVRVARSCRSWPRRSGARLGRGDRRTPRGPRDRRRGQARRPPRDVHRPAPGARTRGASTARAASTPPRSAAPAAGDLPIVGYGDLTADDISGKLRELSRAELVTVDAYERANEKRSTVLTPDHGPAGRRALARL